MLIRNRLMVTLAAAIALALPAQAVLAEGTEENPGASTVTAAPLTLPGAAPVATTPAKPGPAPAAAVDYAAGKAALDKKDWAGAIASFTKAAALDPTNADIANFLGFANRNAGNYPRALAYYSAALKLNPNHRGAHEYLGETYVKLKQLPQAKAELAALKRICGNTTCEEYKDLAKAIASYGKKK